MNTDDLVIKTEKIVKGVWIAKTWITKPLKVLITMRGNSKEDAITKLKDFLSDKDVER